MARVFKDCFLTVLREQQSTELAIFPLNVSVQWTGIYKGNVR